MALRFLGNRVFWINPNPDINVLPRQADASGALEAVRAAVSALPQDRVALRFLLAAASDITASDVDLAFASEGIILGFNQEPSDAVQAHAKQLGAAAFWV